MFHILKELVESLWPILVLIVLSLFSKWCLTLTVSLSKIMTETIQVVTQCPAGQEYCCGNTTTAATIACGVLQSVPTTAIVPSAGQANFGEFPWQVCINQNIVTALLLYFLLDLALNDLYFFLQALILTKQNDYIAGGVLINSLNVITVTHRLLPYV